MGRSNSGKEVRKDMAEKSSEGTRKNAEVMQMKKSYPRNLPGNLYALREILCTFSALLCTLFGYQCPFYVQVFRPWEIMDTEALREIDPSLNHFVLHKSRGRCWRKLDFSLHSARSRVILSMGGGRRFPMV